jgi:2-keto-4-pentenoate hydratase
MLGQDQIAAASRTLQGHWRTGTKLGDPRIALAWLANELRQFDLTLRAGEAVTTGLPSAAADPVRRCLRRRFRCDWMSIGGLR